MLTAEAAILIHLESVGIVFLVLLRIVITLLALRAGESDLYSHVRHLLRNSGFPVDYGIKPCLPQAGIYALKKSLPTRGRVIIPQLYCLCQDVFYYEAKKGSFGAPAIKQVRHFLF